MSYHFLFLSLVTVTYLLLVLVPVVKTFLVYYLPTVARPCVLPPPFLPFFLQPLRCHLGSQRQGSGLKFYTNFSRFLGRRTLFFFRILFFCESSFLISSLTSSFLIETCMFFSMNCRYAISPNSSGPSIPLKTYQASSILCSKRYILASLILICEFFGCSLRTLSSMYFCLSKSDLFSQTLSRMSRMLKSVVSQAISDRQSLYCSKREECLISSEKMQFLIMGCMVSLPLALRSAIRSVSVPFSFSRSALRQKPSSLLKLLTYSTQLLISGSLFFLSKQYLSLMYSVSLNSSSLGSISLSSFWASGNLPLRRRTESLLSRMSVFCFLVILYYDYRLSSSIFKVQ